MAIKEVGQSATEVALQGDPGLIKNADGETVIAVTADEKVGIGTTNPGSTLEVKGGHITATDADVAHGVTNVAATDAYGDFGPIHATYGGLMINGISDQESASARSLALRGISNDTHTDTVPLVEIIGAKRSGTSVQSLADAETILTVANHTDTKMTILGSGNLGLGTTGPDRKLDILDDTNPQLRLTHTDATEYLDIQSKATGDAAITMTDSNMYLRSGDSNCYLMLQNTTTGQTDSTVQGLGITTYGLAAGIMMYGAGATIKIGCGGAWAIDIDASRNTTAVNNLLANGNVTLGDAPADVHTINGTAGLAEASTISINTPLLPTTDHTATGLTAEMLAGEAITAFNLVCISAAQPGEVLHTDANAAATMPAIGIAVEGFADAATGTILLQGFVRDDTWAWTQGAILYASATIGGMTETAPAVSGDTVQAVAIALNPDVIYFNPSLTLVTVA